MMTPYQEFIYKRTYSRWLPEANRRETWEESVARYGHYMRRRVPKSYYDEFNQAIDAIMDLQIMPSMRAFWSAGPALDYDNIAAYNCAYLAVDSIRAFPELLYILMNGAGVGFSVERQCIFNLPEVADRFKRVEDKVIVFADSKRGWADGYRKYLNALWVGMIPTYDLSKIRPEGARLKTFGGRASGPEPLKRLLEFTKDIVTKAAGRKLNSLECHDICCMIANIVVVGGVRRSACISLGNLSDDRHAKAKSGEFQLAHDYRRLANNSVAYTEQPDAHKFLSEWMKLIESKCGERGIFNREAAQLAAAATHRRDPDHEFGLNPCGEVILRSNQFCNLSEVVVRHRDALTDLCKKVELATILGCVQSTLTDFKFIGKTWKDNCEEERLLGVSLTGLMDHPQLGNAYDGSTAMRYLCRMKEVAIATARKWSGILDINMPAAITTCKPSGTVSQLVNSSSGIHPRFAPYYLRRVMVTQTDPVAHMLIDQGVTHVYDEKQRCYVFEFPQASPPSATCTDNVSAIEQLQYWRLLKTYWTEHNPSCTVHVEDHEWPGVGAWVYDNWDSICGLTFYPKDTGVFAWSPFEKISKEQYNQLVADFPAIDFTKLSDFEKEDKTEGSREYACTAGGCEI
jgi:ribonucleoside-triphosphate reductase